ncbi:MAG: 50S ribosomal protein L35 [Patescibacteria group bacterium]|jgi:large subunit ribosomal protein L35
MKTHKAVAKRVRVTKTGKVMKRHGGQDHFNARDSGNATRKKRRDQSVAKQYERNIKNLLPFA